MEQSIPEAALEILNANPFSYFSVVSDGRPSVVPALFALNKPDTTIYVAPLMGPSQPKFEERTKACLTIDVRDAFNPFNNEGVMIQGSIHSIPTEKASKILPLVKQKYGTSIQSGEVESFQIHPTRSFIMLIPQSIVYWKSAEFKRWHAPSAKEGSQELTANRSLASGPQHIR